jgi:hypothetical protein
MSNLQYGPTVENGWVDKRKSGAPTATTSITTPANFASVSAMETRLLAVGYTAAQLRQMTQNDKIYALRLADESASI